MTRLRATFRFKIGELFVRRDELGSSHELAAEPPVRLQLPSADVIEEWASEDSPFTGGVRGSSDDPPELRGVRHVLAIVEFDADFSAADFPAGDHTGWPIDRALEYYEHAYELARDGYQRFRAWARVSGDHHRLGMSPDEPEFAGVQSLVDLNAGRRIPVGYPPIRCVIWTYDRERRERVKSVAAIVRSMEAGAPPVAATLLADASAIYSHEASAADHQRAVLLAAIASEMTVKERLRELASSDMAALVDVILSNPREVTQTLRSYSTRRARRSQGSRSATKTTRCSRASSGCSRSATPSRIAASCQRRNRASKPSTPPSSSPDGSQSFRRKEGRARTALLPDRRVRKPSSLNRRKRHPATTARLATTLLSGVGALPTLEVADHAVG